MSRIIEAIAYYDVSDPDNEGWAYRLTYDDDEQESGPTDALTDEFGEVLSELEALVTSRGGAWDGGEWVYSDAEGGSYRWTAPEPEPADDDDGEPVCESGKITGERCAFDGDVSECEVVEWMPEYLRASHEAAGNWGSYPHNGALRLRVCPECRVAGIGDDDDAAGMRHWHIHNKRSGTDLGVWEAPDEAGALDALARDAGYPDHATAEREFPSGDDIVVTEVAAALGGGR